MGALHYQGQHDKIGIKSMDTVPGVGVVAIAGALESNKLHHLVFSFTGNRGIGEDNLDVAPARICLNLPVNKPPQVF